jgi:naphthalene 1,2-dioxygenase system ferredoxin subunit
MADVEWHRAAALADLREGEMLGVQVRDATIALVMIEGHVYAVDNLCTHDFAMLSQGFLEGREVECPLHAARFDVVTGKCLAGPDMADLRTYPVRVLDDEVQVGLQVGLRVGSPDGA